MIIVCIRKCHMILPYNPQPHFLFRPLRAAPWVVSTHTFVFGVLRCIFIVSKKGNRISFSLQYSLYPKKAIEFPFLSKTPHPIQWIILKVNQSLYRPGQTLRVPGAWGSQISRHSAREGGKVVSPTHRPPLPPKKCYWYSFLLQVESTTCSGALYQWKIPLTPATFQLAAQCLDQVRQRVAAYRE